MGYRRLRVLIRLAGFSCRPAAPDTGRRRRSSALAKGPPHAEALGQAGAASGTRDGESSPTTMRAACEINRIDSSMRFFSSRAPLRKQVSNSCVAMPVSWAPRQTFAAAVLPTRDARLSPVTSTASLAMPVVCRNSPRAVPFAPCPHQSRAAHLLAASGRARDTFRPRLLAHARRGQARLRARAARRNTPSLACKSEAPSTTRVPHAPQCAAARGDAHSRSRSAGPRPASP
jgi:hypothetical protein